MGHTIQQKRRSRRRQQSCDASAKPTTPREWGPGKFIPVSEWPAEKVDTLKSADIVVMSGRLGAVMDAHQIGVS